MSNKAIFFDRDDTLIHDSNYMHKIEQIHYVDHVFKTLKEIQDRGYKIFIVTNQSGIGRGYFHIEDTYIFHEKLIQDFKKQHITIEEIVFCPHAPEDKCDCRKPHPKLLLELCQKHNIDPSKSYMVGDKLSDVQAGLNAGMKGVAINFDYELRINKLEEILDII